MSLKVMPEIMFMGVGDNVQLMMWVSKYKVMHIVIPDGTLNSFIALSYVALVSSCR